jgi:hypothetical protein
MALAGMQRKYTLHLDQEEMTQDSAARQEVIGRLEKQEADEGDLPEGARRYLNTLREIERVAQQALKER